MTGVHLLELLAALVHLLHHLGMLRPLYAALFGLVEYFRVQVEAALALVFFHFNLYAILVGPCVAANAGHLPGHFDAGRAGLYRELIVLDLA